MAVDLEIVQPIASITVWGRTDCCPEMTSNFYVFVSDNPFTSYDFNTTLNQPGVDNYPYPSYANPASIPVNRTARYVRVQMAGAQALALAEVQVWIAQANVSWMVADHLGTPRMIVDKTGNPAGISRHEYLPFGEEIFAGMGGRTTGQGYASDGVRQQFTGYERDGETSLDFAQARYYSSPQGRFTSIDPENAGADEGDPQSWNGYAYARNNPMLFVDPDGLDVEVKWIGGSMITYGDSAWQKVKAEWEDQGFTVEGGKIYSNGFDPETGAEVVTLIGTYQSDMNELGEAFIREMSRYVPAHTKFMELELTYMTTIMGGTLGGGGRLTTLGNVGKATPLVESALGLTTKAAAREAIEKMAVSEAAKAAARRAVTRATTKSTIDVVKDGTSLVIRVQRAGHDGHQVLESVIRSDGTKTVVQKAYDAAGNLVHYHPK